MRAAATIEKTSMSDMEAIEHTRDSYQKLRAELAKRIIGQGDVLEQLVISIFAGGHCLLEGVPGLAKTLMISSLAEALSLEFKRIQFTPDLMPNDHHRHRGYRPGKRRHRARLQIPQRPDLRRRRPRRRNQPNPAQDPGIDA